MAAGLLERALGAAEGDAIRTTQLLAPLVEARLACGDLEGARVAAGQLADLAESSGIRLVEARARLAEAQVSLAAGRPDEAAEPARAALAAFGRLGMPLHVGEARLALARAVVEHLARRRERRGAHRARGVPRAGGVAGDGRRRRRPA